MHTVVEEAECLPPTTIFHGDADTAVVVGDSRAFVDKVKSLEKLKETEIRLVIREGMEHGFDEFAKRDEQRWLREQLEWVEGKWLATSSLNITRD
ncbi:hypothetical protein P280DRAFT_550109 [Massarina eburnea CBS 473.64]|uniref:Uncharacterized protein n=1 Tax=Massarina eburnea CBS 473.64 TaxID=1395130 RepID=A0A6A6S0Z1_9PLEO|nr:hypothetical protein P280DRAFT_550109 [Massarina eburnea CBS 473.64]